MGFPSLSRAAVPVQLRREDQIKINPALARGREGETREQQQQQHCSSNQVEATATADVVYVVVVFGLRAVPSSVRGGGTDCVAVTLDHVVREIVDQLRSGKSSKPRWRFSSLKIATGGADSLDSQRLLLLLLNTEVPPRRQDLPPPEGVWPSFPHHQFQFPFCGEKRLPSKWTKWSPPAILALIFRADRGL